MKNPRVTGLGGAFFKARNPAKLAAWYKQHLGLPVEETWCGCSFEWRDVKKPTRKGCTVWSIFEADSKYFGAGKQGHMFNYRVTNLKRVLAALKKRVCGSTRKRKSRSMGNSPGSRMGKATVSNYGSRPRCGEFRIVAADDRLPGRFLTQAAV